MNRFTASLRVAAALMTLTTFMAAHAADNAPTASRVSSPPASKSTTSVEAWKEAGWKDPEIILTEVNYKNMPLGEVAANLRELFKDMFDVIAPHTWQSANPGLEAIDPSSVPINIQLKNVSATEVFNAMNMVLQAEGSPVRWELKMNGRRPVALLTVLPQLLPPRAAATPEKQPLRLVIFVGDLLGDEKSGSMTMEQLVTTISDVYKMSLGDPKGVVQFHKSSQLLVVTGTNEQLLFVQQALEALKEKVQLDRVKAMKQAVENKPKSEEPKVR